MSSLKEPLSDSELLEPAIWDKIDNVLKLAYQSSITKGMILSWEDYGNGIAKCHICKEIFSIYDISTDKQIINARRHSYNHFLKIKHLLPFI